MSYRTDNILNGGYSSYLNDKFHNFQGLNKSLDEVKYQVEETLKYAEKLEDENKALKSDLYEKEEIKVLSNQIELLKANRGFDITPIERKHISDWKKAHIENQHNGKESKSAIGGGFEYTFYPTSIGTVGCVHCVSCMNRVLDEYYDLVRSNINEPTYEEKSVMKEKLIKLYDAEYEFQGLD